MLESIKRFFAYWHRISRHKVPRWVRGRLYHHRYVKDRAREYKVIIRKYQKQCNSLPGLAGNANPKDFYYLIKKVEYYYREI